MKFLVTQLLTWCSRRVLDRHKPVVIAITGSVGKTSTKEAIATVLKSKFNVRTAKKNLNTEVGVPLTILGIEQPRTKFGWLRVIGQALGRSSRTDRTYVEEVIGLAKLGFRSRRKQLHGNLSTRFDKALVKESLREMGLNEKVRAQELSVEEWVGLAERLMI